MKDMAGDACPMVFNFDADSFKPGDLVSYRVTGSLDGMPFAGTLMEVHDDFVVVTSNPEDSTSRMRATRQSRPVVREEDIC